MYTIQKQRGTGDEFNKGLLSTKILEAIGLDNFFLNYRIILGYNFFYYF